MHGFYVDWTKNMDIYNYLYIYIGLCNQGYIVRKIVQCMFACEWRYFLGMRNIIIWSYIIFIHMLVYILIYNLTILSFFVLLNVVDNIDRKINDYKLNYINKNLH
ncbi:LOW QUALITY PROTEIN: hypothetical protein PFTANZ_00930 [Plasmodium falciparum Tanzania (2000708)]|uniref:Uncharacterized protein n=1 Tax=Plasmodium falciparum Tanzania (2000708) TaxID=1036725 RepID=A0A024WC13_PLAFA|nr:LOW QUALITY PROTEIN: hypothetical protein PFTANZ_00930 [Plasmodium falciparum Tanzania (2000708)]